MDGTRNLQILHSMSLMLLPCAVQCCRSRSVSVCDPEWALVLMLRLCVAIQALQCSIASSAAGFDGMLRSQQ